jgi:accessory gene regulator B
LLAGGYHSNTYWGCFFVTLIGISIAVFGGVYFEMSIYTKYIIFIISVIITVIYAPIDHFNKPIISVERRKRFKLYSIASFLFFGSLSLMIESELSAVGLIGLMIEAISLPAGYYLQRWDKT